MTAAGQMTGALIFVIGLVVGHQSGVELTAKKYALHEAVSRSRVLRSIIADPLLSSCHRGQDELRDRAKWLRVNSVTFATEAQCANLYGGVVAVGGH